MKLIEKNGKYVISKGWLIKKYWCPELNHWIYRWDYLFNRCLMPYHEAIRTINYFNIISGDKNG